MILKVLRKDEEYRRDFQRHPVRGLHLQQEGQQERFRVFRLLRRSCDSAPSDRGQIMR